MNTTKPRVGKTRGGAGGGGAYIADADERDDRRLMIESFCIELDEFRNELKLNDEDDDEASESESDEDEEPLGGGPGGGPLGRPAPCDPPEGGAGMADFNSVFSVSLRPSIVDSTVLWTSFSDAPDFFIESTCFCRSVSFDASVGSVVFRLLIACDIGSFSDFFRDVELEA